MNDGITRSEWLNRAKHLYIDASRMVSRLFMEWVAGYDDEPEKIRGKLSVIIEKLRDVMTMLDRETLKLFGDDVSSNDNEDSDSSSR